MSVEEVSAADGARRVGDRSFLLSALGFESGMPHSYRPIELPFAAGEAPAACFLKQRDDQKSVMSCCWRVFNMYDVERERTQRAELKEKRRKGEGRRRRGRQEEVVGEGDE